VKIPIYVSFAIPPIQMLICVQVDLVCRKCAGFAGAIFYSTVIGR
jgi:hypothetical protein